MRRTADREMVNATARYSVSQRLLYLNNPKVACSTIKASLWKAYDENAGLKTYTGDPHSRLNDPFIKNLFARKHYDASALANVMLFSVVRNPFVRILSAYLDKIGRDPWVWLPFARRFGIHTKVTKAELSFRDFLVILNTDPDELLDVHFRPQYLNLLWPVCRPHFIGHMEKISEVFAFLSQHNVRVEPHHYHATGSRELINTYYENDTIDLVREKYAADFRIFGYSTDIACIDEHGAIEPDHLGGCEPLTRWIMEDKFPYELMDDQTQRFEQFRGLASRETKVDFLLKAYQTDDSWSRLQTYAAFAVQAGEHKLAQNIIGRLIEVCGRHYSLVRNRSIFVNATQ